MLEFPGEGVNLRKSSVFCENLRFGLSVTLVPSPQARPDLLSVHTEPPTPPARTPPLLPFPSPQTEKVKKYPKRPPRT